MNEPYVNTKAAAEYLQMSVQRVYNMTARKEIPHYQVGRSLRFRLSELDKWMELRNKIGMVVR